MMTPAECRAKADRLAEIADAATSYDEILGWGDLALEWRRLAVMADWQEAMEADLRSTP